MFTEKWEDLSLEQRCNECNVATAWGRREARYWYRLKEPMPTGRLLPLFLDTWGREIMEPDDPREIAFALGWEEEIQDQIEEEIANV